MVDFSNLYGGAPADQRALSELFAAVIQGANASAGIKASGYQHAVDSMLQGLNAGLNRGEQRYEFTSKSALDKLLAGQSEAAAMAREEVQQQAETAREQSRIASSEKLAGLAQTAETARQEAASRAEALARLGEAGIAHQGLSAAALMDRVGRAAAAQPLAAPPAPKDPWWMAAPDAGILRLGLGLGMMPGAAAQSQSQGGSFDDIPTIPVPPTVAQQRFRREQQVDQETLQAISEATQFANSSQGQKTLYHPIKMSRLEALGVEDFPPDVQEAILTGPDMFPGYKPTPGIDGEVDRSKLDGLLKWLGKETEVNVPNEAGFLKGREYLANRVSSPKALQAAMESIAPHSDMAPARTMAEAREMAKQHILKRMAEIKAAGNPAQLQGGGDLLKALQGAQEARIAVGPVGAGVFNKDLVNQLGWHMSQLPRELQDAAALGYPIAPDKDGRIVFKPTADGTPVPKNYQAALDAELAKPANAQMLQALLATGATIQQSPSDLKKAATARQVTKAAAPTEKAAPAAAPGSSPKGGSGGAGQPSPEPQSALDQYRASKMKKAPAAPAAPKKDARFAVPPMLDLIGRDPSALLRLLAGAGRGP